MHSISSKVVRVLGVFYYTAGYNPQIIVTSLVKEQVKAEETEARLNEMIIKRLNEEHSRMRSIIQSAKANAHSLVKEIQEYDVGSFWRINHHRIVQLLRQQRNHQENRAFVEAVNTAVRTHMTDSELEIQCVRQLMTLFEFNSDEAPPGIVKRGVAFPHLLNSVSLPLSEDHICRLAARLALAFDSIFGDACPPEHLRACI